MSSTAPTRIVKIPPFILSYPKVEKPVSFKDQKGIIGKPQYGLEMIVALANMSKFWVKAADNSWLQEQDFKQVCMDLAKEAWPGQKLGDLFPRNAKTGQLKGWGIQDGDVKKTKMEELKKTAPHYEGTKLLHASSNADYPPNLLWIVGTAPVQLDRENPADLANIKKIFVSGSICRAECNVKAIETPQGQFIKLYIGDVLFLKKGPSLGQGGSAADRWAGVLGGESDIDPTAQDEFGSMDEFEG